MLSCDWSSISRPWSWVFTSLTSMVVDFNVSSVVTTSCLINSDWEEKKNRDVHHQSTLNNIYRFVDPAKESLPLYLGLVPVLQVSAVLIGDSLVVFSGFLQDLGEVLLGRSVHLHVHLAGHLRSHGQQVLQEVRGWGQSGDDMRGRPSAFRQQRWPWFEC